MTRVTEAYSMTQQTDVLVIGLGGMGSAAAYQLARRGKRVIGLEQFAPVHDRGSSHGQSRIIRQAYFEDPAYVPLVLRSYELWRQLEHCSAAPLLTITGGLMLGAPDSAVVAGSLASARQFDLPHAVLTAPEIHRRFPPFTPSAETVAVYEHNAGFVRVEMAVRAHLEGAQRHGANLHFEEPVHTWDVQGDRVVVTTPVDQYEAERLVIAPGAWAPRLLTDLSLPLAVERQVQFWFTPQGDIASFRADRFPVFIWHTQRNATFYGVPAIGEEQQTVKCAIHHGGEPCDPDTVRRTVTEHEVEQMRQVLDDHMPRLNGSYSHAVPCLYTNTPDHHFVIATHPQHPNVVIAAGFSGHGFKFAPVVGEILADLTIDGTTQHPIELFSPCRLTVA
jgi:sarcosine oxidase